MITINEHNYETYLLLLLDNELSAEEQAVVWAFIQQNPFAQQEYKLLQQVYLQPDALGDEQLSLPENFKASLLSKEPLINAENYTQFFAAYVDGELTTEEKLAVEQFVETEPAYKASFIAYNKTKLVAETIVYPYKKQLLRGEEKNTRVIPFLLRFTMAAAVVGICLVQGYQYLASDKTTQGGTKAVAISKETKAESNTNIKSATNPTNTQNTSKETVVAVVKPTIDKRNAKTSTVAPKPIPVSTNYAATNTELAATESPLTNAATDDLADASMETAMQKVRLLEANELEINNEKKLVTASNISNSGAYNIVNTDEDNSMYVGALELNKTKVKSLLKRAGNILGIGRPANKPSIGNEPIQVANFEIDPKNKTVK
jgi:hypothetical protein